MQFKNFKHLPEICLTIIYLLIIGIYAEFSFDKFKALEPNELGDFLAGAFAPLAFMWLAFGYFQQGKELQQNTEALRLQAKELQIGNQALQLQAQELNESVKQQMEQVRISTEQLNYYQQKDRTEAERIKIEAKPHLVLTRYRTDPSAYSYRLTNHGEQAKNIKCLNSDGICWVNLSRGDNKTFSFLLHEKPEYFEFSYSDTLGNYYLIRFTQVIGENGDLDVIKDEPLDTTPF